MIEQKLTAAKADNIQIKQLYESAFPENERIPWPDLMRLIDEMHLDFTTYEDNNQLVGFTIVYPGPKVNWFWYFAVKEELRGQGMGQQILTRLIQKYEGKTCVLDMESPYQVPCPNPEQRSRRQQFYLRNGFRDSNLFKSYEDIEMTMMIIGSESFTMQDWDAITNELRQHWSWV